MSVRAGTAALGLALQRLLVVAAAVAVLGHGGVELAPRLLAAGASVAAVSADTPSVGRPAAARPSGARPAADSQPVPAASTMRLALVVTVPVGSADPAAGPGSSPLLAPHLVARPVVRPPIPSHLRAARGGASGRGPPAPAGT